MEPLTDVFGTQTSAAAMAIGLRGIVDWSVQQPFLDVFKTARPWSGNADGQWGAYREADFEAMGLLDENGWLTRIPDDIEQVQTLILTEMPAAASSTAGLYRLSYDGAGDIGVSGAEIVSRTDGEIWFDHQPTGNGMVVIAIRSTDPQNTGDYLRNIEVVKQEHIPAYEAGQMFNPLWLDVIAESHALRFMDWQETNNSTIRNWSEQPQQNDYTYNSGVPLSVMVALANATGTEPWFNMPFHADEAYIREFASYVRDALNPDLRAHYEFSNEVWNWMFDQATDSADAARARFGQDLGDGWMQEYGARSAEMARVLDDVYAGAEDHLVKVLATHTYWPGLENSMLDAPAWQALSGANAAPYQSFDTYAITGYFGNSLGTDAKANMVLDWISESETQARQDAAARGLNGAAADAYIAEHRYDLAVDMAMRELRDGSISGNSDDSLQGLFEMFRYHKSVADSRGLDLVMYEGGTHVAGVGAWVDNDRLTDFFIHLNFSDGMGELYAELLDGWEAAGGTLFNAFVDVSEPTKWGSWGLLRHLDDSTPRHDAVVDFMRDHPAPDHMKDGTWASQPVDFGPAPIPDADFDPAPDQTPVAEPDPVPQTDADPDPVPDLAPNPNPPAPSDDVREYVFGNSHYVWAVGNPELSVAHWVTKMAESAGHSYATALQTGMLTLHDDLPPDPHITLPTVREAWDPDTGQSFADAEFNQITISAVNFVQGQSPDTPYWIDPSTSPVESALRIIEWAESRAPGAAINIYETWPHLAGFISSFPPSAAEVAAWESYMMGEWHDWWVSLTEEIRSARPDLDVRHISVGPEVAAMLDDPSLGLTGLGPTDLYIDDAPHGTPTLYFLASMLHYATVFGETPPRDLSLPDSVHPAIAANLDAIVEWIEDRTQGPLPNPIVNPYQDQADPSSDSGADNQRIATPGNDEDRITSDDASGSIDGATGPQTAVFDGHQSGYTVRFEDDIIRVEHRATDSNMTLRDVDTLDFGQEIAPFGDSGMPIELFDGMADLDAASMAALTELYIAYFNRAPDAIGLFYWGDQMAGGMSLTEIAGHFFDQPETRALYGDLEDLPEFVQTVYQNVLGRAPDAVGMAYWLDQLEGAGPVTPPTFIQSVISGAKADTGGAVDAAYLANKVLLGGHFAITRGMSDVEDAALLMQGFDGSATSTQAGFDQTDAVYADILSGADDGFLMQLVGIADTPLV